MSRIAAIQMNSGHDVARNLEQAREAVLQAAESGAALAVLPENFARMPLADAGLKEIAEAPGDGPLQGFLADLARESGIWLVGGTLPLQGEDPQRVRSACLLIDERGECRARYDKIHLFDVEIAETGERYAESDVFEPGDAVVVADSPVGRLGLSICFDLRFPGLFQALLDEGAEVLAVPAAFTAATGAAHWDVLTRARAIETQCYLAAAGQTGHHPDGRQTFGHSRIVDPWGRVLDELEEGLGIASGEVDRNILAQLRRRFPVADNRRFRSVGPD